MLCLAPGVAGPQLDFASALRVAESLGAATRVAVTLLGMIREGMDEGFAKTRTETRHG